MNRSSILVRLAALAILLLVGGCGGQSPQPALDEEELDRLRALPYVGSSAQSDAATGVVTHDQDRAWPGYTLFTTQMLSRAELIDMKGRVTRAWDHSPSARWERAELLPNGDLIAIGAEPSGRADPRIPDATRYVLRLDWNGNLLWKHFLPAHHDVEPTPDDQLLILTFQRRKIPTLHPQIDIRDDQLSLLDRDGLLVQSRSLLDAFVARPDLHRLRRTRPTDLGVRPWIDVFHANSVQWMRHDHLVGRHPIYDPGNVLVCSRHQSCIAVIHWEDGSLVWAWGADELSGPHDAQVLENGHILVFDNGLGREWSRVIELDPLRRQIVWEYRAPQRTDFYTLSKGSNQRLPNGNTLIANSDNGVIFEVTPEGARVWEFRNPHQDDRGRRAAIVRAVRYEGEVVEALEAGSGN
jgi:hypothetical protein